MEKVFETTKNKYIKFLMKVTISKPTKSLKKIFKNNEKDELKFVNDFIEDIIIIDNLQPVYKKDNIEYTAFYDDEPYGMTKEDHRIIIQDEILIFLTKKIDEIEDYIYSYIEEQETKDNEEAETKGEEEAEINKFKLGNIKKLENIDLYNLCMLLGSGTRKEINQYKKDNDLTIENWNDTYNFYENTTLHNKKYLSDFYCILVLLDLTPNIPQDLIKHYIFNDYLEYDGQQYFDFLPNKKKSFLHLVYQHNFKFHFQKR